MTPRLALLLLLLVASVAFGQGALPDHYPDDFVDHGPDGLNMIFWMVMLVFIALCCVLVGVGIALGVAILVGLAVVLGAGGMLFGAGGMLASVAGGIASRKPRVGWRIFSMWMHAGFMMLAGTGIGGFVIPFLWSDHYVLSTAVLGALTGLGVGLLWGWLLALGVERCGGFLKKSILPHLGAKPERILSSSGNETRH